jgi:hypothetical protein
LVSLYGAHIITTITDRVKFYHGVV